MGYNIELHYFRINAYHCNSIVLIDHDPAVVIVSEQQKGPGFLKY